MFWTIERIESPPEHFRVALHGTFDLERFREMVDQVCAAREDFPFEPVLFDDRDLDLRPLSYDDLVGVSHMFAIHNSSFAFSKVAILMRSKADFELATNFVQKTQPVSDATFTVFRQESDALLWLREQSGWLMTLLPTLPLFALIA